MGAVAILGSPPVKVTRASWWWWLPPNEADANGLDTHLLLLAVAAVVDRTNDLAADDNMLFYIADAPKGYTIVLCM